MRKISIVLMLGLVALALVLAVGTCSLVREAEAATWGHKADVTGFVAAYGTGALNSARANIVDVCAIGGKITISVWSCSPQDSSWTRIVPMLGDSVLTLESGQCMRQILTRPASAFYIGGAGAANIYWE